MKMINWDLEESVALMHLYFSSGAAIPVDQELVLALSCKMRHRGELLQYEIDDKFRNVAGLNMQLACIHYVVTDGKEGLSGASRLFYETYDLYLKNKIVFDRIVKEFNRKY